MDQFSCHRCGWNGSEKDLGRRLIITSRSEATEICCPECKCLVLDGLEATFVLTRKQSRDIERMAKWPGVWLNLLTAVLFLFYYLWWVFKFIARKVKEVCKP
jgi:hypothetical protein